MHASSNPETMPVSLEIPDAPVAKARLHHALVALGLVCLCVALYSWTADFPMEFDDYAYLIDNPIFPDPAAFRYPANFVEFVNRPAQMGKDGDYAVNFVLRPVAYASFFANHLLDGFRPRWFRLVNIGIHACNSLLIYALLHGLLGKAVRRGNLARSSQWFISIFAAFLFAAHPLATESVTYIVQRFTSMAAMFSLLTLWLHWQASEAKTRSLRIWARVLSVVTLLVAMQTKEGSFTVPLLAVMMDRWIAGRTWRRAFRNALPLLVLMPVIPVLLILITAAQNEGWVSFELCSNIVNSRDQPFTNWGYFVTQITVVAYYLRLLLWPAGMNLDPEWPVYHALWQGPVAACLLVFGGSLAAAWALFRRDSRGALILVAVIWFFLTISVSSSIVPLPDLVAEHRAYFPSIGFFLAAACLFDRWRAHLGQFKWPRLLIPAAAALIISALSWATCARNEIWRTAVGLWSDTAAKSPGKYRVWGNLGTAHAHAGDHKTAVECYRRAIALEPMYITARENLTNSLLRTGRPEEAIGQLQELMKIYGGGASPRMGLLMGEALLRLKRFPEARKVYTEILAIEPSNGSAHLGMGLAYQRSGLPVQALRHYRKALEKFPDRKRLDALIREAQNAAASAEALGSEEAPENLARN